MLTKKGIFSFDTDACRYAVLMRKVHSQNVGLRRGVEDGKSYGLQILRI